MEKNCENCGCGKHHNLDKEELEKIISDKEKHKRKYNVKYRTRLAELNCRAEEVIDRVKAYAGIVDEVEFTEEELIISFDDRLITPAEISDIVN